MTFDFDSTFGKFSVGFAIASGEAQRHQQFGHPYGPWFRTGHFCGIDRYLFEVFADAALLEL